MTYFNWKYCAVWLTSEAGPRKGLSGRLGQMGVTGHFWTKNMINGSSSKLALNPGACR